MTAQEIKQNKEQIMINTDRPLKGYECDTKYYGIQPGYTLASILEGYNADNTTGKDRTRLSYYFQDRMYIQSLFEVVYFCYTIISNLVEKFKQENTSTDKKWVTDEINHMLLEGLSNSNYSYDRLKFLNIFPGTFTSSVTNKNGGAFSAEATISMPMFRQHYRSIFQPKDSECKNKYIVNSNFKIKPTGSENAQSLKNQGILYIDSGDAELVIRQNFKQNEKRLSIKDLQYRHSSKSIFNKYKVIVEDVKKETPAVEDIYLEAANRLRQQNQKPKINDVPSFQTVLDYYKTVGGVPDDGDVDSADPSTNLSLFENKSNSSDEESDPTPKELPLKPMNERITERQMSIINKIDIRRTATPSQLIYIKGGNSNKINYPDIKEYTVGENIQLVNQIFFDPSYAEVGTKEKNIFFNKSLVTISPERVNQIISKIKEKEGPSSSSEVTPSEIKNIISNLSISKQDIEAMEKKQQMNQLVNVIRRAMVNVEPVKKPEAVIPAISSGPIPQPIAVGIGGKKKSKRKKNKRKSGKQTKRGKRR